MSARRPRLPMFLGLATLTVAAHLLAGLVHAAIHPVTEWPILVLLAAAPIGAVWLMMRGRARHGAGLLALTMTAAAFHTLYSHFVALGDAPGSMFYAGTVQMLLAFELQGLAAGMMLLFKPQVPHPRESPA